MTSEFAKGRFSWKLDDGAEDNLSPSERIELRRRRASDTPLLPPSVRLDLCRFAMLDPNGESADWLEVAVVHRLKCYWAVAEFDGISIRGNEGAAKAGRKWRTSTRATARKLLRLLSDPGCFSKRVTDEQLVWLTDLAELQDADPDPIFAPRGRRRERMRAFAAVALSGIFADALRFYAPHAKVWGDLIDAGDLWDPRARDSERWWALPESTRAAAADHWRKLLAWPWVWGGTKHSTPLGDFVAAAFRAGEIRFGNIADVLAKASPPSIWPEGEPADHFAPWELMKNPEVACFEISMMTLLEIIDGQPAYHFAKWEPLKKPAEEVAYFEREMALVTSVRAKALTSVRAKLASGELSTETGKLLLCFEDFCQALIQHDVHRIALAQKHLEQSEEK